MAQRLCLWAIQVFCAALITRYQSFALAAERASTNHQTAALHSAASQEAAPARNLLQKPRAAFSVHIGVNYGLLITQPETALAGGWSQSPPFVLSEAEVCGNPPL